MGARAECGSRLRRSRERCDRRSPNERSRRRSIEPVVAELKVEVVHVFQHREEGVPESRPGRETGRVDRPVPGDRHADRQQRQVGDPEQTKHPNAGQLALSGVTWWSLASQ